MSGLLFKLPFAHWINKSMVAVGVRLSAPKCYFSTIKMLNISQVLTISACSKTHEFFLCFRLGQTMVIPVLAHRGSTDLIASSPQTSTSAVKIILVKMELLVCPTCPDTHVLAPLASRVGTVKMLLTIVKPDHARMMAYVSHSLMTTNVFAKTDSLAEIAKRTTTTVRILHVQMEELVLMESMILNAHAVLDTQEKIALRKLTSVIPIHVSMVVSARTETTLSPASASHNSRA
jgi:hypothetical protein